MKKNIIKETYEALNMYRNTLKEAYMMDEEEPQLERGQEVPQESMEGEEMMDNHMTDEIIDQIRQLALDGIQKYAEDVDNEMYVTYKKIWMMCDKCLSEKDKVEN